MSALEWARRRCSCMAPSRQGGSALRCAYVLRAAARSRYAPLAESPLIRSRVVVPMMYVPSTRAATMYRMVHTVSAGDTATRSPKPVVVKTVTAQYKDAR